MEGKVGLHEASKHGLGSMSVVEEVFWKLSPCSSNAILTPIRPQTLTLQTILGLLIIYLARERSTSLICVMYMDLMPHAHVAFFKKQVPVVAYVVRYM